VDSHEASLLALHLSADVKRLLLFCLLAFPSALMAVSAPCNASLYSQISMCTAHLQAQIPKDHCQGFIRSPDECYLCLFSMAFSAEFICPAILPNVLSPLSAAEVCVALVPPTQRSYQGDCYHHIFPGRCLTLQVDSDRSADGSSI